jgi:EAL domain-containing protein (putative c-di-GMP-specific phosphodiesterase class I)/ActR/RegA family two-component response regulator
VLIVDDDQVQGTMIRNVCNRIGFHSEIASSYERAAELLATTPFTHVTIDLALGERDGIELLRLLSELKIIPRVIVISGCDQRILNSAVRLAQAAGSCDAISLAKPVNLAALRMALTAESRNCSGARVVERQPPTTISTESFRSALQSGEIFAAFQPKVQLSSGKLIGCEALARWSSPTLGVIGPDRFVPLAEAAGLIKPMTMLMLRETLALTRDMVRHNPAFVAAVNFSATLLNDPEITDQIEQMLSDADIPGRSLMVEVTETTAMCDISMAMDTLLRLRIKGIGLSMDDFGTGYSSMAVLAQMPFCELKIDRSFVKNCLSDPDLWKVVKSAVAIADAYDMKTVAEGIEDFDTLQRLKSIGCNIGQGYILSQALPRQAFLKWPQLWEQQRRNGLPCRIIERNCA